jgi:hypothetical protein
MPPCQTSTFTSDGVNIIKQPEGITLEPTKMANVPAEVQEITNGVTPGYKDSGHIGVLRVPPLVLSEFRH